MKRWQTIAVGTTTLALALGVGCSSGSGGSGGGTPGTTSFAVGAIGSQLTTPNRAQGYQFSTQNLNQVAGAGEVVALGAVSPTSTDSLAVIAPSLEAIRVGATGNVSEGGFLAPGTSVATVGTLTYVATGDDATAGNGDLFQRNAGTGFPVALDTNRDHMVVAAVGSEIVAAAGGGAAGEIYHLTNPTAQTFSSVASLGSVTPTAIAGYDGLVYMAARDNVSGSPRLFRTTLSGAVEEVSVSFSGDVTAMAAIPTTAAVNTTNTGFPAYVLAMTVGSFDSNGNAVSGSVLLSDGTDFETTIQMGGDAPTSMAWIDDTLYVGTANGALKYRDVTSGSPPAHTYLDEPNLPAFDSITSLRVIDGDTLLIGGAGAQGAQIAIREAGAPAPNPSPSPSPSPSQTSYASDVKPILMAPTGATACTVCHVAGGIGAPPASGLELSAGLANDSADIAALDLFTTAAPNESMSSLLQRLDGRLTHTGGTLQAGELATIEAWIADGQQP